MESNDSVLTGIARCLWAMAWADAMEEAGKSVSGDIYSQMPNVPDVVLLEAAKMYGAVEQICGAHMPCIIAAAHASDLGISLSERNDRQEKELCRYGNEEAFESYRERFGECIAYRYVGAGVCWTDDHKDFRIPSNAARLWSTVRFGLETPWQVREAAEAAVSSDSL
jgi:hypothetical protein